MRCRGTAAILAAAGSISARNAVAQDGYVFTTVAGRAGVSGGADGSPADARFNDPLGIALDPEGNLYVADEGNFTVRKISATEVRTVAGSPGRLGATDGQGAAARFGAGTQLLPTLAVGIGPSGIAVLPVGNLVVAEWASMTLRLVTPNGSVGTIAGEARLPLPNGGFSVVRPTLSRDGTGTEARFAAPFAVATDAQGTVFVADSLAHTIRKVTDTAVTTFAGVLHVPGGSDGVRATATFNTPAGLAVDRAGNVYVVDSDNFTIRKIAADGTITTLAGTRGEKGAADGTGAAARFGGPTSSAPLNEVLDDFGVRFKGPQGIAIGADGELFVTDTANHTLRRISPAGAVTTIAGAAGVSGATDGTGPASRFNRPVGIAVDPNGILYLADSGNHTIRKGTPGFRPRIIAPENQAATPGQTVTLTVAVTGSPAPELQWTRNGAAIPGATGATLRLANVQAADAGAYAAVATNVLGSATSAPAVVTIGSAPVVTSHPTGQSVLGGQDLTLRVVAGAAPEPLYQWLKDGTSVAAATNAALIISSAQAADAGVYQVRISNGAGTTISNPATVTVNTSRIVNLSIRTTLTPATPVLTVGFVVAGDGKTLLARGVGPALAQFGVAGALADPRMTLFAGNAVIANNDDWGTAANTGLLAGTTAQVGAFALVASGADAALLATVANGNYSTQTSGPSNTSGTVLVELYDANPTTAARLVNVSARAQVGTGDGVLVAGFVLTGNAPKTLLIRAVGPALGTFGVSGVLADPRLDVIAGGGSEPVVSNDNWGGGEGLRSAFSALGAFPLAASDSRDAAVLVTLEPGVYSAQVSGVGSTTGEALVEIYEVR